MSGDVKFLSELPSKPWKPDVRHKLRPIGLFVGDGNHAIEVVAACAEKAPSRATLLSCWKERKKDRAAPVILVALHPDGAELCGASGKNPPVYSNANRRQVENICREVLRLRDRHAALRFLKQTLPSLETDLPGIHNKGLLSQHELEYGTRRRDDWEEAQQKAAHVLKDHVLKDSEGRYRASPSWDWQNHPLLTALGFQIEKLDRLTALLKSDDHRTALAVVLRDSETPETKTDRFNDLSPVSYALNKADRENLPWVIFLTGNNLRLYATDVDAGVGRRGRTETYIECQPILLLEEHCSYLWLLFSAEALTKDGSLRQILEESERFSGDLAKSLRERIYEKVVPQLAQGIAEVRNLSKPSPQELTHTYQMALTVLFRLLFIAYAEDRDLLPYRHNDAYRRRSLKQKAMELAELTRKEIKISQGDSHWREFSSLCEAVSGGKSQWGVPAYNGALFTDDAQISSAGAELAGISLPDRIFETALRNLLVTQTTEGVPGPVDFRSLGVREFGTIYEGLLESELALAETDLKLGKENAYMPAAKDEPVAVHRGEVYLHNRSGARKSSGSYYTKHFAVEHLLKGALKPALESHFDRLRQMGDDVTMEAFFDFRVADIAMGSGHFLVAAIDHIERDMADFLAESPVPEVQEELEFLRNAARKGLGETAETVPIEDGQLLRRLIARRCIYGVDINELAVQLSRLAVWIHTFVPGLPLSFLDRNLVHGNSLVGIGTFDELRDTFAHDAMSLFIKPEQLIGAASQPLKRLAGIKDASLKDIKTARKTDQEIKDILSNPKALFDLITARPISDNQKVQGFIFEEWEDRANTTEAQEAVQCAREDLQDLHVLHFPIAFPEVFLRKRQGFDVILGNPPWEKAKIEVDAFWARYSPGLRGLSQSKQEDEKERLRQERPDLIPLHEAERKIAKRLRQALVSGPYPEVGTGDPDLYKAFCWRFWHLISTTDGCIGVVLPRNVFASKGSVKFRQTVFEQSTHVDITTLINNRQWIFPIHPQYSIGLVCIARGQPMQKSIRLRGPFASQTKFNHGIEQPAAQFSYQEVQTWNDIAALPLLPDQDSVEVFVQLRKAPDLGLNQVGGGGVARASRPRDGLHSAKTSYAFRSAGQGWRARPDTELHSTGQKNLMSFLSDDHTASHWLVYKGESFDLWNPDTGVHYAKADPKPAREWLQQKRLRGHKIRSSPHREFPLEHLLDTVTLPCLAPRIVFRDVTHRTNQRTVIATLIPPEVFATSTSPYFLWPRGDKKDQAFLLGVLASIPLDWYARCFVENHVTLFLINSFPIPRPGRDDKLWQRTVELAGRLACPDERFAEWAEAVSVECGPLEEDQKDDMIYELDAVVAHLYGLKEKQLIHIFKTFHKTWDFESRLKAVLKHFRAWNNR